MACVLQPEGFESVVLVQDDVPGQKEQAVLHQIKQFTPRGDAQAVLDAMDSFGWSEQGFLSNIGNVKGAILDSVVERCQPLVRKCCACSISSTH